MTGGKERLTKGSRIAVHPKPLFLGDRGPTPLASWRWRWRLLHNYRIDKALRTAKSTANWRWTWLEPCPNIRISPKAGTFRLSAFSNQIRKDLKTENHQASSRS